MTLLTFALGVASASLSVAVRRPSVESPAPVNHQTPPASEVATEPDSERRDFSEAGNCPGVEAAPIQSGIVSICVWNGKALRKPAPAYPPLAKAAGVKGSVGVGVVVNESGEVVWAEALDGHPLLRRAARDAACRALFTPTLLSGRPVRVRGVLTYKFMLQ